MFTVIFNDEKHLCILEEFISDYFGYKLEEVRGNLEIKSRRLKKEIIYEKGKEVDLLLNYKGKKINIEMSTGINAAIIDRNIMFLSKIHSLQADKGDNYKEIRETVQINLLANSKYDELKISFSFANIEKKIVLREFPRIDMISMEIGKRMCYTGNEETDKLIRWSKIFLSKTKEELEKALKETVSTKSKELLLTSVTKLSGDEEMVKKYEEKSKWQITQELLIRGNLEEELSKKYEEKYQKEYKEKYQKEYTKKLLDINLSLEDIEKVTGLTQEEIEKLKNED